MQYSHFLIASKLKPGRYSDQSKCKWFWTPVSSNDAQESRFILDNGNTKMSGARLHSAFFSWFSLYSRSAVCVLTKLRDCIYVFHHCILLLNVNFDLLKFLISPSGGIFSYREVHLKTFCPSVKKTIYFLLKI